MIPAKMITARYQNAQPAGTQAENQTDERRLPRQAFQYWHRLKGDQEYPKFTDMTAEGLEPFKDNGLLLDIAKGSDSRVRFIGKKTNQLLSDDLKTKSLQKGEPVLQGMHSAIADQMIGHLEQKINEQGTLDLNPTEFEYSYTNFHARGIYLPFSLAENAIRFVWVVVTFRRGGEPLKDSTKAPKDEDVLQAKEPSPSNKNKLSERLEASRQVAGGVVHPDNSARFDLYGALADAFEFYENTKKDPLAFNALLAQQGLKVQKRAPYTPALKMVFGTDYDKTRITEYAAALAWAARQGVKSDGLAAFLKDTPGGIKGCVALERQAKRGGHKANKDQQATLTLVKAPALDISDLQLQNDFAIAVVRRSGRRGGEIVNVINPPKATMKALMYKAASGLKKRK